MNVAINDIYEIAKWFLHTEPMTHKKLQKLLYFRVLPKVSGKW